MKLSHLTEVNRLTLRSLRDCGIIRASGEARLRFNDLVFLGFANPYHVAEGVTNYRLTSGGRSVAGVVR